MRRPARFNRLWVSPKLREPGLKAFVLETGTNVGGTWYWNRYPRRALRFRELDLWLPVLRAIYYESGTGLEHFASQPETEKPAISSRVGDGVWSHHARDHGLTQLEGTARGTENDQAKWVRELLANEVGLVDDRHQPTSRANKPARSTATAEATLPIASTAIRSRRMVIGNWRRVRRRFNLVTSREFLNGDSHTIQPRGVCEQSTRAANLSALAVITICLNRSLCAPDIELRSGPRT